MELEEQQRRQMVERQKAYMIREIASATGQSAQMLRAIDRRACNAPSSSQTEDRRAVHALRRAQEALAAHWFARQGETAAALVDMMEKQRRIEVCVVSVQASIVNEEATLRDSVGLHGPIARLTRNRKCPPYCHARSFAIRGGPS